VTVFLKVMDILDRRGFLGRSIKGSLNAKPGRDETGDLSLWGAFACAAGMYALARIIGALNRSEREYRIELIKKTVEFARKEFDISSKLIDFDAPMIPGVYCVGATTRDALDRFVEAYMLLCPNCAEDVARFLSKRGLDVFMVQQGVLDAREAPLTKTLLRNSSAEIVKSVLESAFFWYIKENKIDIPAEYNQQIITYLGLKGTIEFFSDEPEVRKQAEAHLERRIKQSEFIRRYSRELTDCYQGKGKQRRKILKKARKEWFKFNEPLLRGSRFLNSVNNAFFYHHGGWAMYFDDVIEVFGTCSVKEYLSQPDRIHKLLVERCAGKTPY
jgi:hypothetical protein